MTRPRPTGIRPGIVEYGKLTSLEIGVAARSNTLLILPLGACEQHGDGLPLATDTIRADHVSLAVASAIGDGVPGTISDDDPAAESRAFVLPTLGYGVSPHHGNLPGTISLDPRIVIDTVTQIAGQLAAAGFTKVLVVTGHGGNIAALGVAAQVLLASHPQLVFAYSPVSALAVETNTALTRTEVSGHSGESETAQVLAIDDTLVDTPRLHPGATALDELGPHARLSRTKSPSTAVTFDRYAPNGVLGDPRTATAADGENILGEIIGTLTAYARQMLAL